MPDYKRLVSYMYNYEDGTKRNNVGYARVEARNGQCKCTLHIAAPSLNEKQIKAYIFRRKNNGLEGILLGVLQIKNGMGDYKVVTDSSHIMNSPYRLEDMGGIVLYLSERKYFATEWDDKGVTMSMVSTLEQKRDEKNTTDHKEKVSLDKLPVYNEEHVKAANIPEQSELNVEGLSMNELQEKEKKEAPEETIEPDPEAESEKKEEYITKAETENVSPVEVIEIQEKHPDDQESAETEIPETEPVMREEDQNITETEVTSQEQDKNEETDAEPNTQESGGKEEDVPLQEGTENKSEEDYTLQKEDIETKEAKETEGLESGSKPFFEDHPVAKRIYRSFPRMYPFEDNEIAWCVRIEPQDIGLFPMEAWVLGNNSFLLHGYYSYRHLIFARINDKNGFSYILGVPGIYHNREKFMAKMFGFENFKCAKRKAQRTGEFGYWYIPIVLN